MFEESALALAAAIKTKKISAVELTGAYIDLIMKTSSPGSPSANTITSFGYFLTRSPGLESILADFTKEVIRFR
jgi:Asp-tRNA(Asn)/Glu-tRNA(Gln) amidotransferase A subunit family amidase